MAVKTIEKMREYNIALFQKIKDAMFNTTRYRRNYHVQETFTRLDGQDYESYILEFSGPNASAKVTVNENIDVAVWAFTMPVKDERSYRYFDINDFAVNGKVDMNFNTYRNNTMKLFKYLFEEAYIMPYDNRRRACQIAHYVLDNEFPSYGFWVLRFLKAHSFSDTMGLEWWLHTCTQKRAFREKDVMISVDCMELMLEQMVQRNELSEDTYVAICEGLHGNEYQVINHRYN